MSDVVAVPRTDRLPQGYVDRASVLMWIIAVLGIAFRAWQYAIDRALWVDEARFALNLLSRNWVELLRPPDYAGLDPSGFLYLTKAATIIGGANEHVLRLVPFGASIGALVLFCLLARRMVRANGAPIAVAVVSFSPAMLYFAAEARPYSLDALITISTLLATLSLLAPGGITPANALIAAVGGILAIACSQTAVFTLAGVAIVLLWHFRKRWQLLVPMCTAWGIAALVLVVLPSRRLDSASAAYLASFWRGGFLGLPTSISSAFAWVRLPVEAFRDPVGLAPPGVAAVLFLYGVFRLRGAHRWLIVAPIVITLLASAARVYPFGNPGAPRYPGRVILFLVPLFALGVAEGIAHLNSSKQDLVRVVGYGATALLLAEIVIAAVVVTPQRRDDIRPAASFIQRQLQSGERVYAHHNALPQLRYYAPQLDARGFDDDGRNPMGSPAEWYAERIDHLSPGSVWFVFAYLSGDVAALEASLQRNGTETARFDAFGIIVRRYTLTPRLHTVESQRLPTTLTAAGR